MNESRTSPQTGWICVALFVITFSLFSPLLCYDFLAFDDQIYVTENPHVQSGLKPANMAWAFQTSVSGNWIPLTWLSHMLDCQWFALRAGGHHLTNILLHAANASLLFFLLQKLTRAVWPSAFVAALFAWHPAHVESVAWIAERKDVLSCFFFLLMILAYASYTRTSESPGFRRVLLYLTTMLFFALGLMSKSMLVTGPFVLLLLDYWPLRRLSLATTKQRMLEKIPLVGLSTIFCGVAVWAQQQSRAVASFSEISLGQRLGHALSSYFDYAVMLICPQHLAIFYPYPAHDTPAWVAAGAITVMAISILALALASREPWLPVGWFWFIGMLVPVIGLMQVGDQAMADRYTYLPAIGFFIIGAWVGAAAARRFRFLAWFAPVLLAVTLVAAWKQIHYWKDTQTVFERARQVTRDNYLALAILGSQHATNNDLAGAIDLYHEALRVKPNYAKGHFYLAHGLEEQGKTDEARAEYVEALRLNPLFEEARIFLGLLLTRQKQYAHAEIQYQAALKINPHSATAHNDLARLFQTQGRAAESVQQYLDALRDDPNLPQAHNNLGVLYLQQGKASKAATELREALRLNPENVETEYNLAQALTDERQWPEAAELWQKLAPGLPRDAKAQYKFGLTLARVGKTREALSAYAHALLINPDFPEALDAIAWIASTDPRPELRNGPQAIGLATRACELTRQQQPAMLLTLAASYAESGRFHEALDSLNKSLDLMRTNGNAELLKQASRMKEAFSKQTAYREPQDKNY